MENELKTLKDISPLLYQDDDRFYVKIELLKAEAIKWIKKAEEMNGTIAIKDFMDFFNLTEEDLKC